MIKVELIYALADSPKKVLLTLPEGSRIQAALNAVGLALQEGEAVGVFAERKEIDTLLQTGDRLEIYRPLILDPKLKRLTKVDKTTLPRRCR